MLRIVITGQVLALLGLLLFIGAVRCSAQQATKVVKPGDMLPIYLPAEILIEANQSSEKLTGHWWAPGPERFYGYAVQDLRDYLQRMSNAQFPLSALDANVKSGVFAGTFAQFPNFKPQQAQAKQAMASADPEAFVVEVQGDRLYILGKSPAGLMAGIYTLLDRLGVRWFAPGAKWENVPALNGLALDGTLNVASTGPSYQVRTFFNEPDGEYKDAVGNYLRDTGQNNNWQRRNRLGGTAFFYTAHNESVIDPELYKRRPELFALVKGKRIPNEIARHKPEVVELAVQNAIKYLKANDGKGSFYNSFSVETGDGVSADEEGVAKFGNATDLNFWFANQVAAGIEKAGLKDKWIGILSYSDHAAVPSFDLHPQVAVEITAGLDFSSGGMTTEQRLDGFRQRKARLLGVYSYFVYTEWHAERPGGDLAARPLEVAATVQRYYDHGARVYKGEDADSWINAGAGRYVTTRLLWDVTGDPEKILDDYYTGAFGPAAGEIRALYEDWQNQPRMTRLTRSDLAGWYGHIASAEGLVKGKPLYEARLTDIKRYYLFLNLLREVEIDLRDPKLPSKEERYNRMLKDIAANRGKGVFAAPSLLLTLLGARAKTYGIDINKLDPAFAPFRDYNWYKASQEGSYQAFPVLDDAQINRMFTAAKLPTDGSAAGAGVLDTVITVFPANATPTVEIRFPRLHGIPGGNPRQYLLKVVAPAPKLRFEFTASNPLGPSDKDRKVIVRDYNGKELKRLEFKVDTPASFELTDVQPGMYIATFSGWGADQLTISGGNTLGAVRAFEDSWGFNPFRPADLKPGEGYRAYFLVPAGQSSLRIGALTGTVSVGFKDGAVIAPEVTGSAAVKQQPLEFKFAPSDQPRIACVEWKGEFLGTQGLVIEGVTSYSPDPSYVLHESIQ
jgi:hypothetical protein